MENDPLFLYSMRVKRTYTGGKLLDEWQHISPGVDGLSPEEWAASTITSRYAEDPATGLSVIRNPEYHGMKLKNYISLDPEKILGTRHYREFGENPGFLTKIIDSDKRLNIQTHPDRERAKLYFDSEYGKTEAWYVMNSRIIDGEDPYVLLGFKPGITREKWEHLVSIQDIESLVDCLHKIPVIPNDVFLVESGVPHAIGSGCMIAEIQEPTDLTFRVEKVENAGNPCPEEIYHQGIGYEKMFDCFDYTGYLYEEILAKVKINVEPKEDCKSYTLIPLIQTKNTTYFSMEKVVVHDTWQTVNDSVFCTAVVLKGSGFLVYKGLKSPLIASDELFFPRSCKEVFFTSNEDGLELLICYPPGRIT